MFKKLISLVAILYAFSFINTFAEWLDVNNTWVYSYNKVVVLDDFMFNLELSDEKVHMKWNRFEKDEDLVYYKVVRSTKNSNPTYPEDSYIKYSSDINFTSYVDSHPPRWTVYYRVCAITSEKNRYCSQVKKVYFSPSLDEGINNDSPMPVACTMEYAPVCWKTSAWEYKTFSNKCNLIANKALYKYSWECREEKQVICTMEYAPVCWRTREGEYKTYSNKCMLQASDSYYKYSWECKELEKIEDKNEDDNSWYNQNIDWNDRNPYAEKISKKLRERADNIIEKFIKRMDASNMTDTQKIEKIDSLIAKLNEIENQRPQVSDLINYLVVLLQEKKNNYLESDILDELEGLFE